jgi:hypothetical protein
MSDTPHTRGNGAAPEAPKGTPIARPDATPDMSQFLSKRGSRAKEVETIQSGLPLLKIADAADLVRLHPDEDTYWSDPDFPYCFINIQNKGQKTETTYLIVEDLVPPTKLGRVKRQRLALASKPHDTFFLCIVPFDSLDNAWNMTALRACQMAKTQWVEAASGRSQGKEEYLITPAISDNPFDEPQWPTASLDELVFAAFGPDRMIDSKEHPGYRRLVGAASSVL